MTPASTDEGDERRHRQSMILHVIDGEEVASAGGKTFETVNPWTREPAAEVAMGGRDEVDRAVAAARAAFDSGVWSRLGYEERGRIMHAFADLVEQNAEELVHADVTDIGKPITLSREFEVKRVAANLRIFADHARVSVAETYPNDLGFHVFTRYEPAGVVAAIVPWNVPAMMASWKFAPALAWGNTVVVKPSEVSPASATILAKLALEAGMPPGVLNVVHGLGPGSAGQMLTEHPDIDRITFTGETTTGVHIGTAAAANLVPVGFELGGKSAHLVFADADLERATENAVRGSFMNAGQICFSGNRVLVERSIYDEFVQLFAAKAERMKIGDPRDPETEIGTLASLEQFEKVSSFFDSIESEGGTVVTGGVGEGWTVKPTIVKNVPHDSRLWRKEVFGPVAAVSTFDTEEEAVTLANDSRYGLAAIVSTGDAGRGIRLSSLLKGGVVWVNTYPFRDLRAPYGGVGASGIGREGGDFSRAFFTEPKQVVVAP